MRNGHRCSQAHSNGVYKHSHTDFRVYYLEKYTQSFLINVCGCWCSSTHPRVLPLAWLTRNGHAAFRLAAVPRTVRLSLGATLESARGTRNSLRLVAQ